MVYGSYRPKEHLLAYQTVRREGFLSFQVLAACQQNWGIKLVQGKIKYCTEGQGGRTIFAYMVLTVTSPFSDLGIN